jgi:uncharacterized protein YjbI with pentapeptide repeats
MFARYARANNENCANADMRGVDIRDSVFYRVDFSGADFTGADLQNADFIECNLSKAIFSGTAPKYSRFSRSNMRGAKFIGADVSSADFEDADLREARFTGAIAKNSYFEKANAKFADFKGAYLEDGRFRGANFGNADLRDAYLVGAYFDDADFSNANLRGADLRTVHLEMKIDGADLRGADLRGAELRAFRKLGFTFDETTDFRFVNFGYADLEGIDLTRNDISGCKVGGIRNAPKGIEVFESKYLRFFMTPDGKCHVGHGYDAKIVDPGEIMDLISQFKIRIATQRYERWGNALPVIREQIENAKKAIPGLKQVEFKEKPVSEEMVNAFEGMFTHTYSCGIAPSESEITDKELFAECFAAAQQLAPLESVRYLNLRAIAKAAYMAIKGEPSFADGFKRKYVPAPAPKPGEPGYTSEEEAERMYGLRCMYDND